MHFMIACKLRFREMVLNLVGLEAAVSQDPEFSDFTCFRLSFC